jgi:multiple sugar transport system substrate-binding protein
MSELKKVDRRKFIYAGLGAAGLIAIGAAAYVAMNPPVVTQTVTTSTTVPTTSVVTTTVPTTSVVTTTVPTTSVVTTTTTSVIKPVTITYATHRWPYEMKDAYERAAALLEKKHPELKTEYIGIPYAELEQKLATILPTPDAPDVVDIGFRLNLIPYFEPLDEYFQKYNVPVDDFINQKTYGGVWPKEIGGDGHYYVFMRVVTNYACINYRKDIFKERGIEDPMEIRQKTGKYPQYKFFDEWYEIIKKCTYERSDGQKVYGYAVPTALSDGYSRWRVEYLPWHYAFGGGIVRPEEEPGKIVVGKEPYLSRNVKVAEFFRTLVKEGLVPLGVEKPKYFDMMGLGLVAQGKEGSWVFARWANLGEQREKLIGTYPNPYYGSGWKYIKEEFAGNGPSITKNCKHKDDAFRYIYYLCTDPEIINQFFVDTLMLPASKTVDLSPAIAKYPWLDAYDYVNKALPTEALYSHHEAYLSINSKNVPIMQKWPEISQAWFEMYQKVILSNENIQDLHIQLQDKLEKIVAL